MSTPVDCDFIECFENFVRLLPHKIGDGFYQKGWVYDESNDQAQLVIPGGGWLAITRDQKVLADIAPFSD